MLSSNVTVLLIVLIGAWLVLSMQRVELHLEDVHLRMLTSISATVVALTTAICGTVLGVKYQPSIANLLEGESVTIEQPAEARDEQATSSVREPIVHKGRTIQPGRVLDFLPTRRRHALDRARQRLADMQEHAASCEFDHTTDLANLEQILISLEEAVR